MLWGTLLATDYSGYSRNSVSNRCSCICYSHSSHSFTSWSSGFAHQLNQWSGFPSCDLLYVYGKVQYSKKVMPAVRLLNRIILSKQIKIGIGSWRGRTDIKSVVLVARVKPFFQNPDSHLSLYEYLVKGTSFMGRKQSTFSFLLSDPFTGLGLDVHSLFFIVSDHILFFRLLNYATLFHSHRERNCLMHLSRKREQSSPSSY